MLSYLFHIKIKDGYEPQALEVLNEIQRSARQDEGNISFHWLRHQKDPLRFTMMEQWESQRDLDNHVSKGMDFWHKFESCLDGAPVSEPMDAVSDVLSAGLTEQFVREFVQSVYDSFSRHDPAETMLAYFSDIHFEIHFPKNLMTSPEEFRNWYAMVGENFDQQEHIIQAIQFEPTEGGLDLKITVNWKARNKKNGQKINQLAHQNWHIIRPSETGAPVITRYIVNSLQDI